MSYKYTASQSSTSKYIVTRKKIDVIQNNDEDTKDKTDESYISLQTYVIKEFNRFPEVISNYYIDDDEINEFYYFASIVYKKIDFIDNNYNTYDYDLNPRYLIYRDELPKEVINKFLKVIEILSETFYENTKHLKHFLPTLTKIKLSEARQDVELKNIVKAMDRFIDEFSD